MAAEGTFKPEYDNGAFVIDVPASEASDQTPTDHGSGLGHRASPDSGVTSLHSSLGHKRLVSQSSVDSQYVHRGSLGSIKGEKSLEDDNISIVCINPMTNEVIEEDDIKTKGDDVSRCWRLLRQNLLLIFLLFGLALGLGAGFILKTFHPELTQRQIMYVEFPGILLLRVLKMVVLPLISSSLIVGMASLPSRTAGRLGGLAALYYLSTTLLAVILGVILVTLLQPGLKGRPHTTVNHAPLVNPIDALLDLVRNAIPDNLVTATFRQTRTVIERREVIHPVYLRSLNDTNNTILNATDIPPTRILQEDIPVVRDTDGLNVLGIVAFCVTFGVVIGRMGPAGKPFLDVCKSLHGTMVRLVKLVTWYSPVGICFLVMTRILRMTDPVSAFTQLGWYCLTVVIGLLVHGFIILPSIYGIIVRKNPFQHMWKASQALLTAFGTASSSATIPVTLRCMERVAKLQSVVCRFVLPVGGTINMDGTALYEAVAAIFIAQVNGISLDLAQVITVSLTATAAAIGAAGLPEGGLVTMVIVLASVGLPIKDVGLIYAVDWLLDRCRTTINVWGDCVGAAVVEKLAHKHLDGTK